MADVATALRAAIIGAASVTTELAAYAGSFPVFTRRPVPDDAPGLVIIVSPDITQSDEDGLSDARPVIIRDISAYGPNDTAANYRKVERIGYALRDLFHRRPTSISVSGWAVARIEAQGPIPAPTDDEQTVGRMVTLAIRLATQN
jgi:hypothetical protein